MGRNEIHDNILQKDDWNCLDQTAVRRSQTSHNLKQQDASQLYIGNYEIKLKLTIVVLVTDESKPAILEIRRRVQGING